MTDRQMLKDEVCSLFFFFFGRFEVLNFFLS